jgi:hypothetical protein
LDALLQLLHLRMHLLQLAAHVPLLRSLLLEGLHAHRPLLLLLLLLLRRHLLLLLLALLLLALDLLAVAVHYTPDMLLYAGRKQALIVRHRRVPRCVVPVGVALVLAHLLSISTRCCAPLRTPLRLLLLLLSVTTHVFLLFLFLLLLLIIVDGKGSEA